MLKIKRFRDQIATGEFTIVPGKVKCLVTPADVVDADEAMEKVLLSTGQFEYADEGDVGPGGRIITQEEIDTCQMILDDGPKMVEFDPNDPRNIAIKRLIDHYGGVDKIPEEMRERVLKGRKVSQEDLDNDPQEVAAG